MTSAIPRSRPRGPRARTPLVAALVVALSGLVLVPLGWVAPAAASSAEPLATQIADEPLELSAAAFRRALFVAADAARLAEPGATVDLVTERVLQSLYADDPGLPPGTAAELVGDLREAVGAPVTGTGADAMIGSALLDLQRVAPPGAAQRAVSALVGDAAHTLATGGTEALSGTRVAVPSGYGSALLLTSTFSPQAVLAASAALADRSSSFATARDTLWRSATGVSITASADRLLADAPALRDNADVGAVAALRDAAGGLSITVGRIVGTVASPDDHTIGSTLVELDSSLTAARTTAAAVVNESVDPAAATRQAADALRSARAAQTALALQTATLHNGSANTQRYVVQAGTAAVQLGVIVKAFSNFASGNISKSVLTGNVVGAALTLVPVVADLFGLGGSGPSAEEVMLQQINRLSQQIADFQNQVNERFDQIDRALVATLDGIARLSDQVQDVARRVDQAIIGLDQARAQIGGVFDGVAELQSSLDRVQVNIFEALSNAQGGQLRATISSALGYAARNGEPLPRTEFNNAAAYLHTFATFTALRSPELNGDNPSYAPQDLATQLSRGIAPNVDFLDQLPMRRGWLPTRLSGSTTAAAQLPNIDDWVLASRAYAQLMLENPGYVTGAYRGWLADLAGQGGLLDAAASAIARRDSATGTRSVLFDHLLCQYDAAAVGAAAACPATTATGRSPVLQALRTSRRQSVEALPGYNGAGAPTPAYPLRAADGSPFDPWGGLAQGSDLDGLWRTLHPTTANCPTDSADLSRPGPLGAMNTPGDVGPSMNRVPLAYQLAHRLGLGTLRACWATRDRLPDWFWPWSGVGFLWYFVPSAPLATGQRPIYVNAVFNHAERKSGSAAAAAASWESDNARARYYENDRADVSYYRPGPEIAPLVVSRFWYGKLPQTCDPAEEAEPFTCVQWPTDPPSDHAYSRLTVDPAMDRLVDAGLGALQQAVYRDLLTGTQPGGSVTSGPLHDSLTQLDGAQALTLQYAHLGLSALLRRDGDLARAVDGDRRPPGRDDVVTALREASTAPVPPPADVVEAVLAPLLTRGSEPLREALVAALAPVAPAAAARAGAAAEVAVANPGLQVTRDQLALTTVSLAAGPRPTVTTPEADSVVTTARPTFEGSAGTRAQDATTVTLALHRGTTSAAPVATATASVTPAGRWSVRAPVDLASGDYLVQVSQNDGAGPTGRSPAVAFTVNVASAQETSARLSAEAGRIVAGGSTTVRGTLSAGGAAVAREPVELWTSVAGRAWTLSERLDTDDAGSVSVPVAPELTTSYQLRHEASPAYAASRSAELTVGVAPRVSFRAPARAPAARAVPVRGRVLPAVSGRVVKVLVDNRVRASGSTRADGRFTLRVRYGQRGSHTVRVLVPASAENVAYRSAPRTVRSR